MTEPPMTRFDVPAFDSLPADIQERITEESERAGFTPNVFLAFAYRPSHFRAFFQYHDALTEHTELTRSEIEMIVVTVSGINDCLYCVIAHGALLRIYSEDPELADKLATNHRSAELSARHKVMLDFCEKLTQEPGKIEESDFEMLTNEGFSNQAIWDIASVVAYYNLSNRMATVADMRPNKEFYDLGRE